MSDRRSRTDLRSGFRLGDRRVLPRRNRIVGPEGDVRVEPRVMDVLVCLAERAGRVVSRRTLNRCVWGGDAVTDHALTNCVSELRQHLGDDAAKPRFIATVPKRGYRLVASVEPLTRLAPSGTGPGEHPLRRRAVALVAGAAVLAVSVTLLTWWALRSGAPSRGRSTQATVAVLPFDNPQDDTDLGYLRFALPDEITTVLTRAPSLAVRPFEPEPVGNPVRAGRKLRAGTVITGHYYRQGGDQLTVILEALDVASERLVWRARLTVPAGDVLALRRKISARVGSGLLPALGVGAPGAPEVLPADAAAYRLYLRSLAVSRDPAPNRRGIELLRRAVELDPGYAPAWDALALRYHRHGAYGTGGGEALERARAAARRALRLDPRLAVAAQRLVSLETEAGELTAAYRRARELVRRRGDSAQAHFALAYVLRYGGALEASQRHCEAALALDPEYHGWRSCAFSYMAAGELERAERFIRLDAGSFWAHLVTVLLRLRQGDPAAALYQAERLPAEAPDRAFLVACLEGRRGAQLEGPATALAEEWRRRGDSEPLYWIATELAHCGRPRHALRLVGGAVDGNFCAFPALDLDPAWDGLRGDPEFRRLRRTARACHRGFRAAVETVP